MILAALMFVLYAVLVAAYKSPTRSQSVTHEPTIAAIPAPPPFPAFVHTAYGPVRVILRPTLYLDGDSLYGAWYPHIRTIFVRDSLSPWLTRAVLEHEVCHVALTDYEVTLPEPVEERVCDAIARQRIIEAVAR